MRASRALASSILCAAWLPVVASAQTIVFQQKFDGGTGVGSFTSFLAGGDGTFDANYNYGSFQYKRYPDYINQPDVFTQQPIPAAPGGTSTTGLRISVDDTSGSQSNLQLLPQLAGGNVSVSTNFKISYDMWVNYNGGNGGGANSTEHMAAGLNLDGTGVAGFAPGGTRANGYLFTSTGEGGNTGDYRINTNDAGDDGPTYEKVNANWTGVHEVDYDHVTGAYIGGGVNPDEAGNSYFESLFPTGTAETPGAPGKQWVHVDIVQHGSAVDYSMNGHHIATLFLSAGTFSGVPTFGFYDRNSGSAGADEPDQFMLYDNIAVTQFGALSSFTATSGNFSNPANWSAGVPSGADQDAVFDGAAGAASVNVSAPVTLRSLVFNSANSYTVGGTSTISLSAETNDLVANAGTQTVTAPVKVTGNLSIYNRDGSTLTLTNLSTDPTKFVDKTGAGTLAVNKIRAAGMTLTTGELKLLSNSGNSKVGALALSGSAPTFDITNNALIIDYTLRTSSADPTINNSPFNETHDEIFLGFNNGDWSPSPGSAAVITSSTAAAVAIDGSNPHKTGIGIAEAKTLFGPAGGMFNGEAVDGDTVLVRYTLLGDANLDGKVNALDFNALATNFGSGNLPGWTEGDTNYDGSVDTSDFTMLATNFGQTLPALGSLVPEPGLGIAALCGVVPALRRRRGSRMK